MRISKYLLAAGALLALGASPALAYDQGTWILRAGPGVVQPKSNNYSETLPDDPTDISGTMRFDVDDATSLVLSGTYMFTRNWAFDVLVAWPFEHDINMTYDLTIPSGFEPTILPGNYQGVEQIATTDVLPPTFSIQYHFLPDADFQPYVGLGFNWTSFSDTNFAGPAQAPLAPAFYDISMDDSYGVAAQVGGDWTFGDHWALNFDVRWIDMETDVDLTLIDPTDPGSFETESAKFEIDPWVYSINLGYHF